MNDLHPDIIDLLVQRATEGLGEAEETRLRQLLDAHGLEDTLELELAAAAASNAFALQQDMQHSAAPDRLKASLTADAQTFFAQQTMVRLTPKSKASNTGFYGWATAAMLAIALMLNVLQAPDTRPGTPAELREVLLGDQQTVQQLPWAESEFSEYAAVTGDVVWSDERQEGYLSLANMPANDPTVSQYQLWIVDPDRDANPVDGGVFDVPSDGSSVVIPIAAKLTVNQPVAFAITREQPGGVVVSQGPLLVVASSS